MINAGCGLGTRFARALTLLLTVSPGLVIAASESVDSWVGGMLAAQGSATAAAAGSARPEGIFGDLSLSLSDAPDPAPTGGVVKYSADLNFTSNSPGDQASDVQVVFFFTAGMNFLGATGSGWSCNPGTVIQCNLAGTLTAPGASALSLDFEMPATPQSVQLRGTASYVGSPDSNSSNNTNIIATTSVIEVGADLSVNVSAGQSTVNAGDAASFSASVGNLGPGSLDGVTLSGTLSGPGTLTGLSGTGWACSNTASSYNCSFAPTLLAGNSTPQLQINASSGPAGGTLQLDANANAAQANAPASGSAQIDVLSPAALSLSKIDTVDPVELGQNFSYLLEVRNTGAGPASGLTLIDNLPPELSFLGGGGAGWSCALAGGAVQCTLSGSLAGGASSTVRIDVSAIAIGEVTNTATVGDALGVLGASASETTSIVTVPQLSLSKQAARSSAAIGETLRFDLVVGNVGSGPAAGVQLVDRLPPQLAFVSAEGNGWSCNAAAGVVFCELAFLAAGEQSSLGILTEVLGPAGNVVNVAEASLPGAATQSASASVSITGEAAPQPDLALDKRTDIDPVNVDAEFNYILTVSNQGAAASGISLQDNLPDGVSFISASGAGWSCAGAPALVCNLAGSLASGASSELQIRVRAPGTPGTLVNQAVVSVAGESNPADNSASVSTRVVGEGGGGLPTLADLQLQAGNVPASVVSDAIVTLQLLPANLGPDESSGVSIGGSTTQMEVLEFSGAGYVCQSSGSSFQCSAPPLPVGPAPALNLSVRIAGAAGSRASLQAQISGPLQDPDPANNQVSISVDLQDPPPPTAADLTLSKQASVSEIESGSDFSYTLTVSNNGPAAATDVVLTDALPAGVQFLGVSSAGAVCAEGAVVSCQIATLAPGSSVAVVINVRAVAESGEVTNVADVGLPPTDPLPGNNQASATVSIGERTAASVEQELTTLAGDDPAAAAAAGPVSQLCTDPRPGFVDVCQRILDASADGRADEVREALRGLTPDEVLGQTAAILELADRQFVNVDARLAELRGGAGGFSLSGLTVVAAGQAVPVSLFQGLYQDDEMQVGGSGDLISPWGGFINGTISWGDQDLDRGNRNVTLDYDSWALTAGVDYRFSTNLVAGVALGYSNFDSDLSEQGTMQAKGVTLSGYGSWYLNDRTYLDGRISYNTGDLEHTRVIRVGRGDNAIVRSASGSTDSDQLAIGIGFGYHYNSGPWVITPNGFLRYIDVSVDAFSEQGAGDFSAEFGQQDIGTFQAGIGLSVTRAFSLRGGVLSPSFDIQYIHESTDDLQVQARLVGADRSIVFNLEPDDPDQSYGNVGLGFVYVTSNGRQAYLSYRETFGLDGLSSGTLNLGARFEF